MAKDLFDLYLFTLVPGALAVPFGTRLTAVLLGCGKPLVLGAAIFDSPGCLHMEPLVVPAGHALGLRRTRGVTCFSPDLCPAWSALPARFALGLCKARGVAFVLLISVLLGALSLRDTLLAYSDQTTLPLTIVATGQP
ncbi:hypothetical protein [Paenibacillus sp. YPG26]|uniref:hypothetical protein n=1 Tax=Paenibacillus sp. YPG26 TaxID=2878915 RepID=UPI00203BE696|nr:hypothetical protein [Paenibacillus sp. YPG26]USB34525.1 hypothetical protein LDO05_07085 [Paenibacillus sp. YPG26]